MFRSAGRGKRLFPTVRCRICGKPIGIITWGVYRKTLVDAEAVSVYEDPEGDEFLRIDGSKLMARAMPFETEGTEPAYKPHRCRK